ncbi:hypothetical protein T484DRAFT_1841946 [Baffinella frigidus]|nr:hypothetical protein T484DRAFT_1841946 [Cryptophyta sp. CCMP2293]
MVKLMVKLMVKPRLLSALRLLSGLRLGEYAFRPEFYRSMLAKAPDPAGGQASTPLGGTPSHFRRVSLSDPPQRPSALGTLFLEP